MDRRYFIYGTATLLGLVAATQAMAEDDGSKEKDDNEDSGGDSGDSEDSGDSGDDSGGDDSGGDDSGGEGSGGDSGGDGGGTDDKGDSGSRDSESAKQRVDAKDAVPLDVVMQSFRQMGDFTLIDVRLQRSNKTLLYVFKYVDGSGKVKKCYFDARTGLPIE